MYPFCQNNYSQTNKLASSLAKAFFIADRELYEMELSPEQRDGYLGDFTPSDYDSEKIVRRDIPKVVLNLLRGKTSDSKAPIAGLSVISSLPVRPVLSEYRALPPAVSEPFSLSAEALESGFQND